uniref:ATP synthase complex subunit 8 n=1 Tax=Erinaceus europaeus TaxID=9365 RepID=A0A1S2XAP1_ERIEU|nr:ATP synthase F0 subunit 8 [Erinaceus europaeus]QEI26334.1 ATP synthase F0 subunit 8 [Erinaceus europaeus]
MPQLDTSSWFTMILAMFLTLFIIMQLKINSYKTYNMMETKKQTLNHSLKPWEHKWTKIYLPLLLPLHY